MSLHVHLVPDLVGAVGASVTVEGTEAHHAVAVRRLRVGEQVALTDGRGRTAVGEVTSTAKAAFAVTLTSSGDVPEPTPELVVVQALPKGDRGELAVAVLTEVGAAQIVPWAAERCVTTWKGERGDKALARWRSTARESAKQARRSWFPDVTALASTAEVAALVAEADLTAVLHESATQSLADLDPADAARIVVVVGPEGGLTDAEVAALTSVGGRAVRLGSEVLRTSTAGLAASAALLARTDRWRR